MNPMYINPAMVTMIVGLVMLFIAMGGILWRFAGELASIKSDVRVLSVNLSQVYEKVMGHKPPSGD